MGANGDLPAEAQASLEGNENSWSENTGKREDTDGLGWGRSDGKLE